MKTPILFLLSLAIATGHPHLQGTQFATDDEFFLWTSFHLILPGYCGIKNEYNKYFVYIHSTQ